MKEYLNKNKKLLMYIIPVIAILIAYTIGASYSFYEPEIGSAATSNVSIETRNLDVFTTNVASTYTFPQLDANNFTGNITNSNTATAQVIANNYRNSDVYDYYLYYEAENLFTHTDTTNNQAEILLQVTYNGTVVTAANKESLGFDMTDLTYKTSNAGLSNEVSGWDVTDVESTLIVKKQISAAVNTTTTDTIVVDVVFVKLDGVDQSDNYGINYSATLYFDSKFIGPKAYPNESIKLAVTNLPTTYNKITTTSCDNGTVNYNYGLNQVEISAIGVKNPKCTLTFAEPTIKTYLNNYIISLANNLDQGDGMVIHETVSSFTTIDNITTTEAGYRYEGANPNNYVWFNNELWRIIGVFGPESHGQTGKQLVKIIRNESLGNYVWNYLSSDWTAATLNALLNGAYYNHTSDTANCCLNYVYLSSSSSRCIPTTCDYNVTGIQSSYQGMIENVTWYLGAPGKSGYQTYTAPSYYQYERQGIVSNSSRPQKVTDKIGLLYPSDYLYAVKESDCARTTSGGLYNTVDCAGKDWLNNSGWTMNPYSSVSDYGQVFMVKTGLIADSRFKSLQTKPVLYLSSSVYKISGTGTQTDPYIIGI